MLMGDTHTDVLKDQAGSAALNFHSYHCPHPVPVLDAPQEAKTKLTFPPVWEAFQQVGSAAA